MAGNKSTGKKTYAELEAELQDVISWFESDNFDIDAAVKKYQRGWELVQELEKHLATAENQIRELKAKFTP